VICLGAVRGCVITISLRSTGFVDQRRSLPASFAKVTRGEGPADLRASTRGRHSGVDTTRRLGDSALRLEGSTSKTQRRRRILVVAPRDPYPIIGGDRLRIHRIARALASQYDLTLLTLCTSKSERDAPLPADGVFKEVHRVVLPEWRSWLNALLAIPTGEPLQVAYYRSSAFRKAIETLAPAHDAVLAHLVRTADYVRDLPQLRMLEMTDAISMSMQRVVTTRARYFDPRQYIYALEALRLRKYERRIAGGFDLVTLTSSVDKSFLFGSEGTAEPPVMVFANGIDTPESAPTPQSNRTGREIVFIGHLGSLQNYDGARFFAQEVLPRIRARYSDVVFRVIGPIRDRAARELRKLQGVKVEGFVPSLSAAVATSRIGVCPNRMSAGIQNKVLEYFANGLAVVCSTPSLGGLEAKVDEHLLAADSPEQWTQQVCRLLEDDGLTTRLANAGRALATRDYRWEKRLQPLMSRLESLFDQRARAVADVLAAPVADPVLAEGRL
jgi:glycosyltransferase involved in cell wall biosynthesis